VAKPYFAHPMIAPLVLPPAVTVAGVATVISPTPPPAPTVGQFWWRNDPDGRLFIYYDDGTSRQWVPVMPA